MSRYEKIITKEYPNPADAAFARSLVRRFENDPRMDGGRLEAMLREGARVNAMAGGGELTPDHARELLSGFAESIGTPPDIMASLGVWYSAVADEVGAETTRAEQETPTTGEPVAGAAGAPAGQDARPSFTVAPVRPAPAPDRAALQQLIARGESAMRAEPTSDEARWYWRQGGSEQYRQAIEAMQAADAAPAPTQPSEVTP
jgi:hypothetical protein